MYVRAFKGPLEDPTVPMQSEEFMQLVLEEENDKVQLLFCCGLINYRAKRDLAAAKRDLSEFLKRVSASDFPQAQ